MSKDFDFDDIGKKMPYQTPESFFDRNRKKIMEQTCGEQRKKKTRLKLLIPAVFLAAAVLTGLVFAPFTSRSGNDGSDTLSAPAYILAAGTAESSANETMDAFIENLSDEELQELAEQSENDIFLF